MITISSENPAQANATRHCTDYRCRKCAARGRWNRRKAWRSGKNPTRRNSGRK
jgi:hypothetical protein